MDRLRQDLRYALRTLSRSPGFTAVAVITLALGIGATSVVFSAFDTVLLTPLPYNEPHRLVRVLEATAWSGNTPLSAAEFLHLKQNSRSLETIAGLDRVDFHLLTADRPERLAGALVDVDFFPMLGVEPHQGRLFREDEGDVGANRVALLSYGYWQQELGADPEILGRQLSMRWNASFGPARSLPETFTVIGVLPPQYIDPSGPRDVWAPLALSTEDVESHNHYLFAFARLAPDVSVADATREVSQQLHGLERPVQQASAHEEQVAASLSSLPERAVGRVRPVLRLLAGAVGFVLLIACANVASLLLARANGRRRELALRRVVGASRGRLIHQLLIENLALAGLGAILGLGFTWAGIQALRALEPGTLPRLHEVSVDLRVLAFTLGIAILTSLLFGLAPMLGVCKSRSAEALRGARASSGRHGRRAHSTLVIMETALASMLLITAGLLLTSFQRLREFPLGFETDSVLSFQIALPTQSYPEATQRQAFLQSAVERLEGLPGVADAAVINTLPISFLNTATALTIAGQPTAEGKVQSASYRAVSESYFSALRISLLKGTSFQRSDIDEAPRVAIVNQKFTERFLNGSDPVGQQLNLTSLNLEEVTIIGLVGNVHVFGAQRSEPPIVYIPNLSFQTASFVLRSDGEIAALASAAEKAIHALDPELPIVGLQPFGQWAERILSRPRFQSVLLSLFAALALILATVGVYGILSFGVSQRVREIGVRMALGARRSDVVQLIVKQGLRLTVVGVMIGLGGSLLLSRWLESYLFGIEATDPAAYITLPLALFLAATVASLIPARRASQTEPVVALRHD